MARATIQMRRVRTTRAKVTLAVLMNPLVCWGREPAPPTRLARRSVRRRARIFWSSHCSCPVRICRQGSPLHLEREATRNAAHDRAYACGRAGGRAGERAGSLLLTALGTCQRQADCANSQNQQKPPSLPKIASAPCWRIMHSGYCRACCSSRAAVRLACCVGGAETCARGAPIGALRDRLAGARGVGAARAGGVGGGTSDGAHVHQPRLSHAQLPDATR